MRSSVWKVIHRIIFVARVVLLILLFAFFLSPLLRLPVLTTLNNMSLQRIRCERIAKNALILQYRPEEEHPQAIAELQNMLPGWQQEQTDLKSFPDNQVNLLLLQSQADYTSITSALTNILATPSKPVDSTQVKIILSHESAYFVVSGQMQMLMQQTVITTSIQVVVVELIIVILSVILTVVNRTERVKKMQIDEKEVE